MTERSNKSFISERNLASRVRAMKLWPAMLPALALLFFLPQQVLAQDASTSCDMQLQITNQTPAVGVAAHPGDDITFQLTIKKLKKLGDPTIESCDGDRLYISARRNGQLGSPGSWVLEQPFVVTSVSFGGGLWSRPAFAYTDARFWGIHLVDLEALYTPLIPEFEQDVTIAIHPSAELKTYEICFGVGMQKWTPAIYVPGGNQTYGGGDEEDGRLDNNIDCRNVIVAPRDTGGTCHGDCEISCCDSTSTCLFSLPQFIDGCLITLKTFYLIVLGFLLLILLMLLIRRR